MKSNKKTARAVGVLFLVGMVAGVVGNLLIQSTLTAPDYLSTISTNSVKLATGAMLMFMTSIWDATHGILMFPILKQRNERIAIGYFGFRIVDSVFLALQVLFILLQIPLGSEYLKASGDDGFYLQPLSTLIIQANLYAYQIGMVAVGLAGLMLCYMFCKAKLVPKFIAVWGFVGYATILGGSVLEVLGFDLLLIHTIPGGLWELFIGVWLIVRGFNSSPIASVSVNTSTNQL
jgi:hypothetical protein